MVLLDGNFALGCGPGTDYPYIQIFQYMLERTGVITNEVLEPIIFVLVNPTVLCFHKWGSQRETTGYFFVPCRISTFSKNCRMTKLFLSTPLRHLGGVEVEIHSFLTSVRDWVEWSNLRPGHFVLEVDPLYLFNGVEVVGHTAGLSRPLSSPSPSCPFLFRKETILLIETSANELVNEMLHWFKVCNNNNNNNNNNYYYYYYYYLLQLGCYPVAVVILHVNKT